MTNGSAGYAHLTAHRPGAQLHGPLLPLAYSPPLFATLKAPEQTHLPGAARPLDISIAAPTAPSYATPEVSLGSASRALYQHAHGLHREVGMAMDVAIEERHPAPLVRVADLLGASGYSELLERVKQQVE